MDDLLRVLSFLLVVGFILFLAFIFLVWIPGYAYFKVFFTLMALA